MKILAGVNGTLQSNEALKFAARLLDPQSDRVVLYYHPAKVQIPTSSVLLTAVSEEVQQSLSRAVFDLAKASVSEDLLRTTECCEGQTGDIPSGILRTASTLHSDLIVVAADSRPRRFPLYLGGVARSLAQKSEVPVLVYRAPQYTVPHSGVRVLLAHDGSPESGHAAEIVKLFHWPDSSEGWIIRVLEWLDFGTSMAPLPGDPVPLWRIEYDRQATAIRNEAFDQMKAIQKTLPPIFHGYVPSIRDGNRVQEICEIVTQESIDLVVLGSRYLGTLQSLLGSTTEGLLQHAPCSVLVVHSPKNES